IGLVMTSVWADQCRYGFLDASAGTMIGAAAVTGTLGGPTIPVTIDNNAVWNSGTHAVTVSLLSPPNLLVGDVLQVSIQTNGGSNPWTIDPNGLVTVASVNNSSSPYNFTYAGPSTAPSTFASGTWNYASLSSFGMMSSAAVMLLGSTFPAVAQS